MAFARHEWRNLISARLSDQEDEDGGPNDEYFAPEHDGLLRRDSEDDGVKPGFSETGYAQTYQDIMGGPESDEEFGMLGSLPKSSNTPSVASAPQNTWLGPAKRASFIPFVFHPLRRLSAHAFGKEASRSDANGNKTFAESGIPAVMHIHGMIAIGTNLGYVMVYGFDQTIKYILGNEKSDSPVTAVTISPDQTYIAVGRASGNVHLYDLARPNQPSRTTLALEPSQVSSGRKEGHLRGSRILHIGFVGARHTSIVSGDEHGRAFWWSLGRVLGVESNDVHILILTSDLILLDIRSMRPVESTPLQTSLLTTRDLHSVLPNATTSLVGSTKTTLQVGTLLHWKDRILACVHRGDFLNAIQVALAYYEDRAQGNLIGLPDDLVSRKEIVAAKIVDLMIASLRWAFSPERLTDDTHYSADGRGVDLTDLYTGLASACIQACLTINADRFLFDEAYEHFSETGIHGIFLTELEPHILSGRLREIPPSITQALITRHDERGESELAESIVWNVDPISLDINQAITLCENHGLWDAMIHVYTRAIKDYIAPLVKLITVVRDIQRHRQSRPSLVCERDVGPEEMAPNAYKLYAYIEATLSGLSYPSGEPLPEIEASTAKTEVYTFLFQGRTAAWPSGGDGVLTVDGPEPPYPYLSLLLRFDTEAFLHSMDIAFEDSYLNDTTGVINRQFIVNLMLDVMDPEYFHPGDITFLHIFVARNLPKYPQFLFIPPSTLHRILVSLAVDPDQSTREDRQLAAEYLLSAYTPHDLDSMLVLFKQASFYRILRASYRRQGQWADLIATLLLDPEASDEVFNSLHEIIQMAGSVNVATAVADALPHLFELGVRQTAQLLDGDIPACHSQAISLLSKTPHKQLAYLRCLLEPDSDDRVPSAHLDMEARHLYVSLLCAEDPDHVVPFLDTYTQSLDLPRLVEDCKNHYEGQMWALDRSGHALHALNIAGDALREKGANLNEALIASDLGSTHVTLQGIHTLCRMAVRLCQEHSTTRGDDPAVEDMWLDVLREIIDLVHATSVLRGQDPVMVNLTSIEDIVVANLRSLVQETLASLLSSSSSSLSFPRLFKRLVDASTTTKGRAYSEFRTILTGMLDSYRAEGEMLGMTTRLVEADLYGVMAELKAKREHGWRPIYGACGLCGEPFGRSEGTLTIGGSGQMAHADCRHG
ncbi:hypothetical protein IAU60_006241 [Kwoniella sp. DSM 27419]